MRMMHARSPVFAVTMVLTLSFSHVRSHAQIRLLLPHDNGPHWVCAHIAVVVSALVAVKPQPSTVSWQNTNTDGRVFVRCSSLSLSLPLSLYMSLS